MYKKALITVHTKNSPTFHKIHIEISALLELYSSNTKKLEEVFQSFMLCLSSIGGSAKLEADALAKDLEYHMELEPNYWSTEMKSHIRGIIIYINIFTLMLLIELQIKAIMNVLRTHFADLITITSNCTEKVADELFSRGLLTFDERKSISPDHIILQLYRIVPLFGSIEEICRLIVESFSNVGGPAEHLAIVLAEDFKHIAHIDVAVGVLDQVSSDLDVQPRSMSWTVRRVFTAHYAQLSRSTEGCLQKIADNLFSNGLINITIQNSPNFYTIAGEFFALISLYERDFSEIVKLCRLFVSCFFIEESPADQEAVLLAKDWEQELFQKHGVFFSFIDPKEISNKTEQLEEGKDLLQFQESYQGM